MIKAELKEMGVTVKTTSDDQKKQAKSSEKDKYLMVLLLASANNSRYKALNNNLVNNYTLGRDNYPKTPQEEVSILESKKMPCSDETQGRLGDVCTRGVMQADTKKRMLHVWGATLPK